MKTVGNYLGQSNGFPIDAETFASIQENIEMLAVIGNIVGDKAILYGCELSTDGLTRSAGYVFLRTTEYPSGEILYYEGGDATTYCKASSSSVDVESEGITYSNAYRTRKLVASTSNRGTKKWSDFIFASDMFTQLNELTPIGTIQMYAGVREPSNKWMLCLGQRLSQNEYPDLYALLGNSYGTTEAGYFLLPNLKGRFVAGYDTERADYNAVGKTGGEEKHTLTTAEMPAHSHITNIVPQQGRTESGTNPGIEISNGSVTQSTGGGQPHENRPPYIVLSYIIRVK